jgi:hypothetical protein
VRFGILAQQKESGADAFALERIQNFRRRAGPGAVIEGEHQFLGAQRQRRREMLAPDPRRRSDIDLDDAFGAERLRIARAWLRQSGQRCDGRGKNNGNDPDHRSPQELAIDRNGWRAASPRCREGLRVNHLPPHAAEA